MDVLGLRLRLDEHPYRESGSHSNPETSFETSFTLLTGYLIARLPPGKHEVELEWRRWGKFVYFYISGDSETSRLVIIQGHFTTLSWHQPLSRTALLSSSRLWEQVAGMQCLLRMLHACHVQVAYAITLRPYERSFDSVKVSIAIIPVLLINEFV